MLSQAVELHQYRTQTGQVPFRNWIEGLRSRTVVERIDVQLTRVRSGNLGDHRELGGGLCEMRLFFGPGYRIYFVRLGRSSVLLLAGGTKSTQRADIRKARAYHADYIQRKILSGRQLPD